MNQATALLGLITETSLHAGAGTSVGVVDLPIQRECHNGWPCVFGSAVKGALRDLGEQVAGATGSSDVFAVFGPDTKNASDNAGALAVGDARLLLLPVRSLTSAFKWVSCPEALRRLKRDADRVGLTAEFGLDIPTVANDDALASEGSGSLFLEEYRFALKTDARVAALIPTLARLMRRDDALAELRRRLVLVSDDMFAHLAQVATPVNAHIALNSETKTVIDGALWYEETLPPETLLYAPLLAVRARRQGSSLDAAAVLAKVTDPFAVRPWLQLGGNETVGMGWCGVSVLKAKE